MAGKVVYDNVVELFGGMNGNILSSVIGAKQYLKGINITCRGGIVRTRPAFSLIDLSFETEKDQTIFREGKWQGAWSYSTFYGSFIIAAVSGNVFAISVESHKVVNMTKTTKRMNQFKDRMYFCQVEQYMIVQDGVNRPLIIDGVVARISDEAANEVPVGTIMAYGHGRLFVKVFGNQFAAGNINQPTVSDNVLKFTEGQYLQGGGSFALPKDLGEITGMAFVQNFESGDGQGPLIVFAQNGFDAFAVYNARNYWSDNDISKVQARGVGCSSHAGIVVTSDDIIFPTYEGMASYGLFKSIDRRLTTMDSEFVVFEDQETQWCRSLRSSVMFDNRVLFTCVAEKIKAKTLEGEDVDDYRFKGLGIIDFDPMNNMTNYKDSKQAVYDGIWTGVYPLEICVSNFQNESACFVFGKTNDGHNVLYSLGTEPGVDCGSNAINCRLYPRWSRFFDYSGPEPRETIFDLKRLDSASLYVSRFENTVNFKLSVKPDGRTDFVQISEMAAYCPMVSSDPEGKDLVGGMPQSRHKIQFPQFAINKGDQVIGRNVLNGYEFEFCLEWDGLCEIKRMSIQATIVDAPAENLPDRNKILPMSIRSDFDYSIACSLGIPLGKKKAGRYQVILKSTNGARGGEWSDPNTWKDKIVPSFARKEVAVIVGGDIVDRIPEGEVCETNNGAIGQAWGTVTDNFGIIGNQFGPVINNYGRIYIANPKSTLVANQVGATVEKAYGQINVNNGDVPSQYGLVDSHNGTILENRGTINFNNTIGYIEYNYGVIKENYGYTPVNHGFITNNYGHIANNASDGTITNNHVSRGAIVDANYGTITNVM